MARRDLLGETRIDPARPEFRALLENLQGNILKPHARNHADLIFFRIKTGKTGAARRWIRTFAAKQVTSAKRQLEEARRHTRAKIRGATFSGRTFGGLLLSASGYRALGVPLPPDPKFRAGMKRSGVALKDPSPRSWESAYRREIHGLVILADNRPKLLRDLAATVRKKIRTFAEIAVVEKGRQWRNKAGQVVEHFGYADGPSQPRFFDSEIAEQRSKGDGIDTWDPSAPLGLVLARDPNAQAADAFGSYLVFRKLEQNVQAFFTRAEDMAKRFTVISSGLEQLAGAFMVGRFEDGTPVVKTSSADTVSGIRRKLPLNNFTYAHDPTGSRCPFQAHIRAANSRTKTSRAQRIVRRGITYGTRQKSVGSEVAFADAPAHGVGLLFMSFQRSIGEQFEPMQKRLNGQGGRPRDPVTGQGSGGAAPFWPGDYATSSRMRYPPRHGGAGERLVKLRGGEYFFAPSLPFLKQL